MEQQPAKRGRGRPSSKKLQSPKRPTKKDNVGVEMAGGVSSPSSPEYQTSNNNSVDNSPVGDIDIVETVKPATTTRSLKKRLGRPPKKLQSPERQGLAKPTKKDNVSVEMARGISSSRSPDCQTSNNNSNGDSPIGDIDIIETVKPATTTKRSKKRILENGAASGLFKSENVGSKGLKKMKINRHVEISSPGRSARCLESLSTPHHAVVPVTDDVLRQITSEATEDVKGSPFMNAVVKVFCVHTEPNFSLPWQRKRQFSSNSSGFIIDGHRVLTNAHSVEHHTQVKLKKRGSDTKYLATVLAIGTECDIAMLTVKDEEFWEGVSPVQFGALPTLQDAVTVVGYPIGGDTISVTSGVVSRIEVLSYVHGSTELLGVQIDAAINAGNSGGPAFNGKGQCVGIAFQSLKHEDAENIGYVIPTPVIEHFISDYERSGDYTGFPILGIEWQKMENPDLRLAMGMKPNQKGVRVKRVEPTAPAATFLKPSDILLSFDGIDIANDGTVPFRRGERIGFSYLVSQKYTEEHAKVKVLRDSEYFEYDIELSTHKRLVPAHIKGKPPSYYIIAGFVFSAVSVPYLRSEYGKDYDYDAPVKLLDKLLYSMAQTEDEQLVVLSQVLVADINIGYEDIVNTQLFLKDTLSISARDLSYSHFKNFQKLAEGRYTRLNRLRGGVDSNFEALQNQQERIRDNPYFFSQASSPSGSSRSSLGNPIQTPVDTAPSNSPTFQPTLSIEFPEEEEFKEKFVEARVEVEAEAETTIEDEAERPQPIVPWGINTGPLSLEPPLHNLLTSSHKNSPKFKGDGTHIPKEHIITFTTSGRILGVKHEDVVVRLFVDSLQEKVVEWFYLLHA
ncbi:hypothetical protein KI387_023281 [Taxus chinensis]|uniref:Protease Do-like PDZ domain-containing protein n=1 Tax=Taxus chinensis TaxID=29808 RepID=A0AA38G4C9_TAXCH|nr:hypothetical protein KI387_023281 [Taxus chinensis]